MNKFIVFLTLFFQISVHAEKELCRLDTPVEIIDEQTLKNGLTFNEVVLDHAPAFSVLSGMNPSQMELEAQFFDIVLNNTKTGFVGVQLYWPYTEKTLGFSDLYSGHFDIQGETKNEGAIIQISSSETRHFDSDPNEKGPAKTRSLIQILDHKIISVALMVPIYKEVVDQGNHKGIKYSDFTGYHQTFCIKHLGRK